MIRYLAAVLAATALQVVFHLLSISTPSGVIRVEFSFLLAFLCAVSGRRAEHPWKSGFLFLIPALTGDLLDQRWGGSLAHVISFMAVRRVCGLVDVHSFPMSVVIGVILVLIDRLGFGIVLSLKSGMDMGVALKAVWDPSYYLTVALFPLGSAVLRRMKW